MISALYTTFLVLHIYMFVFFLIAFKLKNNGVADLAWGGGFLSWLISISYFMGIFP